MWDLRLRLVMVYNTEVSSFASRWKSRYASWRRFNEDWVFDSIRVMFERKRTFETTKSSLFYYHSTRIRRNFSPNIFATLPVLSSFTA